MPDAGPTYLYRFFDGANRLLYVGISVSVLTRMDEHRHQSWWFVDARRIEFEPFPSRRDALKAERAAIQTENPLHNRSSGPARSSEVPTHNVLVRIEPALRERLEQFRDSQEVPPTIQRIMHRAIERFLLDMTAKEKRP